SSNLRTACASAFRIAVARSAAIDFASRWLPVGTVRGGEDGNRDRPAGRKISTPMLANRTIATPRPAKRLSLFKPHITQLLFGKGKCLARANGGVEPIDCQPPDQDRPADISRRAPTRCS